MKRKALSLVLAMAMVASMTACGTSGSSDGSASESSSTSSSLPEATADQPTYKLAIISKGMTNSWYQIVLNGVNETTEALNEEAGYQMVTTSFIGPDTQSDVAVQVQELNDAISAGADCIGLSALDQESVYDGVKNAQAAGIPVVAWCEALDNAPEGAVSCLVGTDDYVAANLAGEELYKKLADRIGDDQVRVGVVSWSSVAQGLINRGLGFIDKFIECAQADGYTVCVTGNEKFVSDAKGADASEKDADIIIEVRVPSQTTSELAATEAAVLLNEADTIGIFGNTQDTCEGILTANENLNKLGIGDDNIVMMGFDGGQVQTAAVEAGTEYGGVNQAPYDIGEQTVRTMLKAAQGETDLEDVDTEYTFYNKDNLNDEEVQKNCYQ